MDRGGNEKYILSTQMTLSTRLLRNKKFQNHFDIFRRKPAWNTLPQEIGFLSNPSKFKIALVHLFRHQSFSVIFFNQWIL